MKKKKILFDTFAICPQYVAMCCCSIMKAPKGGTNTHKTLVIILLGFFYGDKHYNDKGNI